MENADSTDKNNHSKGNLRRSSNSGHLSISDLDSTTSWHSPLRSDDPSLLQENDTSDDKYSKALVLVKNYCSPTNSSSPPNFSATGEKGRRPNRNPEKPHEENLAAPPERHRLIDHLSESLDFEEEEEHPPENDNFPASSPPRRGSSGRREHRAPENAMSENPNVAPNDTSLVVVEINKLARNEQQQIAKNLGPNGGGLEDEVGGDKQSRAAVDNILWRSKRNVAVKKATLALRVLEAVACLVSFSVMAADKTQGWSGDSFDRYKEYRYCLSVNVIASLYSSLQAFDVAYELVTGKHAITHNLRYHFDFSMDQILAYLLISASSSAATRVYDWTSNWGVDEFTFMASASIAMSFIAFVAFAFSSLISGYNLCNRDFA